MIHYSMSLPIDRCQCSGSRVGGRRLGALLEGPYPVHQALAGVGGPARQRLACPRGEAQREFVHLYSGYVSVRSFLYRQGSASR